MNLNVIQTNINDLIAKWQDEVQTLHKNMQNENLKHDWKEFGVTALTLQECIMQLQHVRDADTILIPKSPDIDPGPRWTKTN